LKKPTENDIETLICNPESLSAERKEWITLWIEKDSQLRQIAEWYREFYSHFQEVKKIKEKLPAHPVVIELKAADREKKPANGYVLAAQTTTIAEGVYKSLKTMISEEHHTLLRVLYDYKQKTSRIHVISSYLEDDDIVLIETSDGNIFTSNPGNTVDIPESELPRNKIIEWDKCRIHIPICRIDFYRDKYTGFVTYSFGKSIDEIDTNRIPVHISDSSVTVSVSEMDKRIRADKLILHTESKTLFDTLESSFYEIPFKYLTGTHSRLFFYK
jgi:hypothetical protein